jgi:hypothetical protein
MFSQTSFASTKKLYFKDCAASAQRAPPADGGDAGGVVKRAAKLQQKPSMLGLIDRMRYLKMDRIRPPEERPVNAQPGWPYSQWQPLLHKVWLGGGSNRFSDDVLKRFCREERLKRILMIPLAIPLRMINNLVKKISWFCLILRSLDGLGIFDDMYVACRSASQSSHYLSTPTRPSPLFRRSEEQFVELFRVLRVVILSIGFGLEFILAPVVDFLEMVFSFLFFTLDLSNMSVAY